MSASISRRTFLKGSLAAGGLTIAVSITDFGFDILNASDKKDLASFNPNVWLQITSDDRITITIGNSEMGQGVHTAQAMILADELEADWKDVRVKQGGAQDGFKSPLLKMQITVGSGSVRGFYEPLRKAGAAGRAMLIQAAAETWEVPVSECRAEKGKVIHEKSKKKLAYGKLCGKAAKLEVPKDPPLKTEAEFRYMGKPMPRVDIPAKVSGQAVFGLDVEMKGLHYAVISRPPAFGAKLLSFDAKAAEQIPGVVKVLQIPQGVAVCATSTNAALKGRAALKVEWDKGTHPDMDNASIEKTMMGDLDLPGAKVQDTGDVQKALGEAAKKVEATYFIPFVAHATMEPMNCTALVTPDRCDVWAPNQAQTVCQMVAGQISGLPPDKVHIHTTYLGCGLGRRSRPDFLAETVIVAKALGQPVKLLWTREEDIKYDAFRSAMTHRITGALDGQGKLTGWNHKTACISLMKYINPAAVKDGLDSYCLWGLWDYPDSPHWNDRLQYEVPNLHIELKLTDLPIIVAPWRSVQNAPNAFAIECFIDELAQAAGQDPLEFRLKNLKNNKRATRVLETVAAKAGWGKPPAKGIGRGLAQHACFGTWVAQVVELSVDSQTGKIKVHRVVAAVDCGPVINPDPLVAQIEGAVTMALSTALMEEVRFAKGGVASANFDDYRLIRMSEVPDIEVHIVKNTDKIGGIGEPGVPPLAPALVNAFFNATGVRIRRIPLTPARVLEALKKT
ncbi:MAG: xanthine dehydrogenase family protein molybdopterin-binding subunit [Deltaproteobacteria bacterium]|nr:xanthine dehydrogenase family protein molybdopterin-binding subunit [Deltaproteobacteria bacterium]